MNRHAVALMLAAAAVMAGCGSEGPAAGRIRGREYRPAHTESRWVAGTHIDGTCTGTGFDRRCSGGYDMPGHMEQDYYPDEWLLLLDNGRKDGKGWRHVDESTFHACAHTGAWCDTNLGREVER